MARPLWWRAAFHGYATIAVVFAVWRCSVVNWHSWMGPVGLLADLFGIFTFTLLLWQVRYPTIPVHRPVDLTRRVVDCLIPTHTEPVDVIEPTVIGALRVRGVRRVIVLSNNFREDVRDMALRLGAEYHARNAMEFGKAGNLNAGLAHTDAEFVMTLDADHIPRPDLLERTVGQFDDPKVALVQTPQTFYNTDSFAFRRTRRGLWAESLLFYRHVQPSKNHWNASFYVGTSAVLRRSALDDVDGFATGTVTEDIHTALRLHTRRWRSVFVPEPMAFGLEAASLKEFHSQRRRWALGSFQLLLRHRDSPLWRKGLTLPQRLHYLHAASVHFSGPQRLIQLILPPVTLFTMTTPVTIRYAGFAGVFLGYTLLSWAMLFLYIGRSYHPIHSEAYSIANAPSQTAALLAVVRSERRYKAANKRVDPRERTWVKQALRLLTLLCVVAVCYGCWVMIGGRVNGLVISATVWSGIYAIWMGSMLGYLIGYERRPQPEHESLTGVAKYDWVMRHTASQTEAARALFGIPEPDSRPAELEGAR
jgi:cellulose synthase (UDP-forming)